MNGVRLIFQVPVLLVMLILQKDLLSSFKIKARDAVSISIGGGLAYFVTVMFYLASLERVSVSIATPLSSIYPLFSFILAVVFLKENFSYPKLIGTVVIVSGVILITI